MRNIYRALQTGAHLPPLLNLEVFMVETRLDPQRCGVISHYFEEEELIKCSRRGLKLLNYSIKKQFDETKAKKSF